MLSSQSMHEQSALQRSEPVLKRTPRPPLGSETPLPSSSCPVPHTSRLRTLVPAQMQCLSGLAARHQQAALRLLRQASILSDASSSQLLQQPGVLQSPSQLERQELEVGWPADGN